MIITEVGRYFLSEVKIECFFFFPQHVMVTWFQITLTSERDIWKRSSFSPFLLSKILRYSSHSNSQASWDLLLPATQRAEHLSTELLYLPKLSEENMRACVGRGEVLLLTYTLGTEHRGTNYSKTHYLKFKK